MAEGSVELQSCEETADSKRLKPPDRRKFEEDTEVINAQIREKESEIKALNLRSDESVAGDLRSIRADKEVTIARRKHIDNELREVNQKISKQMETLTKIQSTLAYKNEDRINEAIRRLDHQLKNNNFTLREEKKIVAEIDRMNRSKKALGQYLALKQEIDGFRSKQRSMREDRDRLYKAVTALKTREEDLKKKTAHNRAIADDIRSGLDELYENRRQIVAEFKRAEQEFNEMKKESRRHYRDEQNRKREEERRQQAEQFQKELAEYEASREPYEDERQLCATLITYLQRHMAAGGGDITAFEQNARDQDGASSDKPNNEMLQSNDLEDKGMYVLKKKDDDDFLFGGITRSKPNKRSKRDKRKSTNKPIVHTPEIFAQFASLSLTAPSSISEVPASIDQLREKKLYLESLPPPTGPSIQIDSGPADASDGSAPSYPESALSESIPSTPEVAFDNNQPRFPRVGDTNEDGLAQWPLPRKLSHDSGLCELDCDDAVAPSSTGSNKSHQQGAAGLVSLHLPKTNSGEVSSVSGKGETVSGEESMNVTNASKTPPAIQPELPTSLQDGGEVTTTDTTSTSTDRLIKDMTTS